MGYNPWGLKELNRTERLTQSTVTHRSKDRTHHDLLLGLSRNESVLWPTDTPSHSSYSCCFYVDTYMDTYPVEQSLMTVPINSSLGVNNFIRYTVLAKDLY